ncbi:MAG: efflux RND transporter permease subunit [Bradymonadaceae bacterium]
MASNPIAANLLMLLLLAGGVWTATRIQKEVQPQFQLDIVQVTTTYPGAAPTEVETGVLLPIEEAVRGIQGIKEITSNASEGAGSVTIELVAGADRMNVYQEIDQAVSRIRTFPDEVEEPEVRLRSRQREVMQLALYGGDDIWTLRKLAERLRDRLLNDPAVTQVDFGWDVPEYMTHVEIPADRLRKYDLTLGRVADIIAQSSRDIPAGDVQTSGGEVLLRMDARKEWAEEFAKIPLVTSSSGSVVRLGDIATIEDGFQEVGFHSHFNGKPSVDIAVYRVGQQSPLEISRAVRGVMETFRPTLPPGVKMRVDSSAADDYDARLSLLLENAGFAVLIVLAILAVFLELRLAFWVMMGMAVSFVGGVLFLPLVGVSINMISMFGFLVALGIVVDDAIVVGENIHEYRESGESNRLAAAIEATRQIARPVTFTILTTVVAFVPLLYLPGRTGKYWAPLPAVVITVLVVSLVEALFILPAHLGHRSSWEGSRLEEWLNARQQRFADWFNRAVDDYFSPLLRLALRFRYVTVAAAVGLFVVVGSYAYSGHMGIIMMPQVAAGEIEAGARLPVGTTPEQAAKVAKAISKSTRRMFEEHDLQRVARGVKTNVRQGNFVDVELVMKAPDERDMTAQEVIELWRDEIGDIEGVDQINFEAERGPAGYRQDIEVDLSHSNVEKLEKAAKAFKKRLEGYAATRDVNDNYNRGKTQLDIELLPAGRALGLTPARVGRQVRNAFFGALALRQARGTNEVEVRVKLPREERKDLQTFEDFVIRTDEGVEVPLGDVARVERTEAFTTITRRDGRRVVTVSTDVEPKSAINRVLESLKREDLPELRAEFPGLTWSFEGTQADMRESTRTLWGGFALAMLVIYSLLAIAFGSYVRPLIVLGVVPFGIIGAVLGHILLGYDLSLMSLMGIIALAGVVVNDSLIMIDYAERIRGDGSAFDAIHRAGVRRFRPIMLTTLTTFGGLAPIIWETSNQANHLIPMAISLGFGIVFATSLLLLLVPCLYVVQEDLVGG